jgi:hypothetical protein
MCLRWAINHEDALSVEHAITLMIAWQLMYELERISNDIQVHLVPTLCPARGVTV